MRDLFIVIGLTMTIGCMPSSPESSSKVIYGEDNRIDMSSQDGGDELTEEQTQNLEATVALIRKEKLKGSDDGITELVSTVSLGAAEKLCEEEPFYSEPVAAACSGFLVGADKIVTAAHCVNTKKTCKNFKYVFGWNNNLENTKKIPSENIYSCSKLVESKYSYNGGPDWAIIKLDREVVGRTPFTLDIYDVEIGKEEVSVIGHPSGIPAKIAPGGLVRSIGDHYFMASTDTYRGNSGGPVVRAGTTNVVGILVQGEADYEIDRTRGCRVSKKCKQDACRGETIIKTSSYIRYLEEIDYLEESE